VFRFFLTVSMMCFGAAASAETLRDPTRPPAGYEVPGQNGQTEVAMPRISGVRIGKAGRLVMLDGKAAKVGDVVGGYEVIDIKRDKVRLRRNGAEMDVPLLPNVQKEKRKGQ